MTMLSRAQGCLLGQLSGDALGSQVEFQTPTAIQRAYPHGVREMANGGTWNTLAGQPTDDSEMALALARTLVARRSYNAEAARQAYVSWLRSEPFDCGATVAAALQGRKNFESQANGAMMRISPLGIYGARFALEDVSEWARMDAALTHPHSVCLEANALYAMAISFAIRTGCSRQKLYSELASWGRALNVTPALMDALLQARDKPPTDYLSHAGWVLIAFQNALWQLTHAPDLEEAVVDTVMRGGDTDTNAAICGALLGAVEGAQAIPSRWRTCLLHCRPAAGGPGVHRPRPEFFWPVDALDLVAQLLSLEPENAP